ncbi:MAG: aldo/keto reductase, partial [Gammaproteobacteria bacterium]
MIDRRDFLRLGTGAAFGLAAGAQSSPNSASAAARIRQYVRLGRTGFKISDIGFGSASSSDPALVRYALDRGVNYFDTAESYRFGYSEEAMGAALLGVRDKVILAS